MSKPHVNVGVVGHSPTPLLAALLGVAMLAPDSTPLPKGLRASADATKLPLTAHDHERIAAAQAKRLRKASRK